MKLDHGPAFGPELDLLTSAMSGCQKPDSNQPVASEDLSKNSALDRLDRNSLPISNSARAHASDEIGRKSWSIRSGQTLSSWQASVSQAQSLAVGRANAGRHIWSAFGPCPGDIAERSAFLEFSAGFSRPDAEAQALSECGFPHWLALVEDHRTVLQQMLPAQRASIDPVARRLVTVTKAFIGSAWFDRAVTSGWAMFELFGVDPDNTARDEAWGLVVHLALTPQSGGRLVDLDDTGSVVRLPDGCGRRWERFKKADGGTTAWWLVPELCGHVPQMEARA